MKTQICIAISYQWKQRWCVMIWYDMVLRMLVFIRHQTGVNHEHVSHGRLAQAATGHPLIIMLLLSPAHCLEIIGGCCSSATWDRRHCTLGHLHGPCTAHLNRTSIVFLYNYMERSWGCHEVSQHIYFWLFIICFGKIFPIFPEKYHCPLPCQLEHVTSQLTLTHPIQAFSSETMFQLFILLAHNTFKHSPLTFMHITCTWQFKLRQGRKG